MSEADARAQLDVDGNTKLPWRAIFVFCAGYWAMVFAPLDLMYGVMLATVASFVVLAAKHGKQLAGDADAC